MPRTNAGYVPHVTLRFLAYTRAHSGHRGPDCHYTVCHTREVNMGYCDGWEVVDADESEFITVKQIGVVCISVERVPGGYLPKLSMDDYGDVVSKGTPMSSVELAVDAAESLVPLHMSAVARSFRPFGENADCVVTGHADSDGRFVAGAL